MFAVYGTDGRIFRDTLEKLYEVHRPVHVKMLPQQQKATDTARNAFSKLPNHAIDAYKKVINVSEREEVFHAYQIMTTEVITINSNLTLQYLAEEFTDSGVSQIPVINQRHQITGIITKSVFQSFYARLPEVSHTTTTVASIMTGEVITADPIADIRRIVRIMLDYRINAIPIVDSQDQVVGILSRKDILRAVINEPPLHLFT